MNNEFIKCRINILVFPYRDLYFCQRYGESVRDLQIINALKKIENVRRIRIVNRPVSFYERIFFKRKKILSNQADQKKYWDRTSWDLIGPLRRRSWTEYCYNKYLRQIYKWINFPDDELNILLDFTPISKLDYTCFSGFYIWYDLIDNFRKHNRYSCYERAKVAEKYRYVNKYADLITGVTNGALDEFSKRNCVKMGNGVIEKQVENVYNKHSSHYTFGYTGFITDKFDVSSVMSLVDNTSYRACIYGKVYDKKIGDILRTSPNIDMKGGFSKKDLPRIMSEFRIGLIPYLLEKSHDEDPIKLYDYLSHGKAVISTMQFSDFSSPFIIHYNLGNQHKVITRIHELVELLKNDSNMKIYNTIREEICEKHLWKYKLENILFKIYGFSL